MEQIVDTFSNLNITIPKNNELKSEIIETSQHDLEHDIKDFISTRKNSEIVINSQTQIIYNAPKVKNRAQRKLHSKYLLTPKYNKCRRVVRIQKVNLKHKNQESNISKRFELCYNSKSKINDSNQTKFQRLLATDSVLNASTKILKKASAKENLLLGVTNFDPDKPDVLVKSETSQDTLTREYSESSYNDDGFSAKTVNSVLEISNVENTSKTSVLDPIEVKDGYETKYTDSQNIIENKTVKPYKNDTVNVATVQIDNAFILNDNKELIINDRDKEALKSSLTSNESCLNETDTLTSSSSIKLYMNCSECYGNNMTVSEDGNSSITLVSHPIDELIKEKNSSYFENTDSSDNTLISESLNNKQKYIEEHKPNLLNAFINMGIFPIIPPKKSEICITDSLNDVIITDGLHKISINKKENKTQDYSKNITQKSVNKDEDSNFRKISLPSENMIKEILTETENSQKKTCSEEFRNYTPVPELWEKLTLFLEITIKNMGDSIIEKVSNEIKQALNKFGDFRPVSEFKSEQNVDALNSIEIVEPKCWDQNLQCGLARNELIDELIIKIKNEEPKTLVQEKPAPTHIEIPCSAIKLEKSDSTILKVCKSKRLSDYRLLSLPVKFVKENMLVLVSVPSFCFVLFLIYCFLIMIK